jgi:mRNA-degrading endonuclease RelE of RelBE toxin-antitoxin system
MKYEIIIEKPVIIFLKSHPDIAERFFDKMAILENDLQSLLLDIKLLKGIKDNFRLRV